MASYGKVDYWDERYAREAEPFDWYQRWTGIREVFIHHVQPQHRILHIGCGNSKLAEDMHEDGYVNSVNIDISQVVIRAMQERYREMSGLEFRHMDGKKMEFKDKSFDVIIDKGTMDTILCGENSTGNTQRYLGDVSRVLADHGTFLVVSYGQPAQRQPYLDKPEFRWDITVHQVAKPSIPTNPTPSEDKDTPNVHYIYVCKKR
jgi:EEF1A lysine methyltransferase 4